jgi:DNA uptake protein ComE-like DNA-binding protein
MKRFFWEYLYFSRLERGIATSIFALCLLAVFVPRWIVRQLPPPKVDFSTLAAWEQGTEIRAEQTTATSQPTLFYFDPNTVTVEELVALGLSEKGAASIEKYRSKGGYFRVPADFAKMYALKPGDFERLEPYISIGGAKSRQAMAESENYGKPTAELPTQPFDPNTVTAAQLEQWGVSKPAIKGWMGYLSKGGRFKTVPDVHKIYALSEDEFQRLAPFMQCSAGPITPSVAFATADPATPAKAYSREVIRVDINTAAQEEWEKLPGIGPYWAKKIVYFRQKLGGFAAVQQVAETMNFPDSVFRKIEPLLVVKSPVQPALNLNDASFEQLSAHPYIDAKQARWIVAYRQTHGRIRQLEDLLDNPEIKPNWLEKIRPYLKIT